MLNWIVHRSELMLKPVRVLFKRLQQWYVASHTQSGQSSQLRRKPL